MIEDVFGVQRASVRAVEDITAVGGGMGDGSSGAGAVSKGGGDSAGEGDPVPARGLAFAQAGP